MLGHGGIVVFDDTVDLAHQARFAMEFCAVESCGKCTPCRVGSTRGVEVIDRIIANEDRAKNLELLDDLCEVLTDGSLCALGGLIPYPVQSAIRHFPEDFDKPALPRTASCRPDPGDTIMALIREMDYGTPKRVSETLVTSRSTASPSPFRRARPFMRAASEAGVQIPKLCASDNLEPFGSCRLCLVEIEGRRGTPASCTTPVRAGHESPDAIATSSPSFAAA